jgi:cytochrome c-type biogenesis protein CcmH/NrfG
MASKYAALGAMQRGDLDLAIEQLRRYVQAVPDDALAWATLGQVLLVTGELDAADDAMSHARAKRSLLDDQAKQALDGELEAYRAERRTITGQDAP